MKPSEKRALKEAKLKELEDHNDIDVASDPAADMSQNITAKDKNGKSILDDDVESMRKESFFSNNVKLVTFIITVTLLFALIGPFSIIRIVKIVEENRHVRDAEDISIAQIKQIAKSKPYITWSQFEGFNYEDQSTKTNTVREYSVKEKGFSLVVRGEKSDTVYPDNVHLLYSDDNGTTFVDIRINSVDGFLDAIYAAEEEEKIPLRFMTIEDLKGIAGFSTNISWANFKGFKYDAAQKVEKETVYYVRTYKIAGTDLSVILEGKKISGLAEKATLVNNITLEEKDLRRDDITEFIKEFE